MFKITIKIYTVVLILSEKNDDYYRKGRGEGVIEIILSVNDENYGRPITRG